MAIGHVERIIATINVELRIRDHSRLYADSGDLVKIRIIRIHVDSAESLRVDRNAPLIAIDADETRFVRARHDCARSI